MAFSSVGWTWSARDHSAPIAAFRVVLAKLKPLPDVQIRV
jgi:hypothetical protein